MDKCKVCGAYVTSGRKTCVQCEKNQYRLKRLSDYKQCMKCEHMSCKLAKSDYGMHCLFASDTGKSLLGLYGGESGSVWKAREEGRCLGYKPKAKRKRKSKIVIVGSEIDGKM